MAKDTLRVGLVGANWGLTHIAAWQSVPGVELAAICTSRQDSARGVAEAHGIHAAYHDAYEMLSREALDIVDVTPRPSIRAPISIAVLEAGKHLLQPMPFALDLVQGRRLCALAKEKGVVAVSENLHRHSPTFHQAKALIDAGAIGVVRSFRAFVRTNILLDPEPGFPFLWLLEPANAASALRNFGAHMLHCLFWFFGPVAEVVASLATNLPVVHLADGPPQANNVVDTAAVLLRHNNGIEGIMDISWCLPGQNKFSIDIAGDKGRLLIECESLGPWGAVLSFTDHPYRPVRTITPDPAFRAGSTVSTENDALESLAFICQRMAAAVRNEAPASAQPDFDEALAVLEVVEAAYASHDRRSWVDVRAFSESGEAQS